MARARGDDTEERRALETACQINPQWGAAVRALCGSYVRQGDLKAARNRLEQLATFAPLDAANQVMLAETLWQLGEKEAALERVRQVVGFAPGYERAWECVNRWTREMNCRDVALETALALTQQRGGEARSWLIAAQAYDQPDEHDRRLAALDKALELNPECVDAHDLRARSLAAAKRWEDAYAACHPTVFGENPPVELRARVAWIAAQQGDRKRAIAEMRQVLANSPAMFDGWSSLYQWCVDAQDAKGSLEAAEAMVRIAPRNEYSHGCLGQARALSKDRAGAMEAYRRAMAMNPKYEFAGNALFDMHMEDNDLEAAAATMAILRKHVQSGYVLGRAVQLAVRQKNLTSASEAFAKACMTQCASTWPVDAAADAMFKSGWVTEVGEILRDAVDREGVHAEVACRWARWCAAEDDRGFEQWIAGIKQNGRRADTAVYAYIEALVKARKTSVFDRFLSENRPWLRQQAYTWGSVAYGMAVLQQYRAGAAWTADWRERPDAKPWMLVNAAEAFWAGGNDKEMEAICTHAIGLPDSNAHHLHYLLLAAGAVLRADVAAARRFMERAGTRKLPPDYSLMTALVQGVLEIEAAAAAKRAATYRAVSLRMDRAAKAYNSFPGEPARRRLYRHCRQEVARYRGGIAPWLWYFRWWFNSW